MRLPLTRSNDMSNKVTNGEGEVTTEGMDNSSKLDLLIESNLRIEALLEEVVEKLQNLNLDGDGFSVDEL